MELLLSYIIPAYNCGRYISACLASVFAQGLKGSEFEVIVVDDGSTDDTAEVVKNHCSTHDNIRLVSTPNRGAGMARNEGLRWARGRYVYFMDADDMLLTGGMKVLFDTYVRPEQFPDVVSFHSRTVDKYYKADKWNFIRTHVVAFKGTVIEGAKKLGINNSVWTQLISRKLIEKWNLEFTDHIIGEDMLFMLHVYTISDASLLATTLNIYRYHVRKDSVMNNYQKENLLAIYDSLLDLYDQLKLMRANSSLPDHVLDSDIDACKQWAFTRLCSTPLTYNEFCRQLEKAYQKGLFEIGENRSALNRFEKGLSLSPIIFYGFAVGYRSVFLPYIKPYLRRN